MRSRWYPWPRPLLGFAVAAKNNAMLAGLGVTGMDSPVLRAGAITGGIVVSLLLRSRTFNRPPDYLRRNADDDRNESPPASPLTQIDATAINWTLLGASPSTCRCVFSSRPS
jgi:hypothetical protein